MNSSKSLINRIADIIIIFLLLNLNSFAQSKDTLNNSNDSVFVMQKSPWGAVLRSALLPGWGQIYNESYIKAPIILGGITALALGWRFYNKHYSDYRYSYSQIVNDKNVSDYVKNSYKSIRDFYRDQRDLFSIYIGLAYLLNLVDAYVDAQLFDFNVQEDYRTLQPMLGIKINF